MEQRDERCHGTDRNASGLFIRLTRACDPGGKSDIDQGELFKAAAIFELLYRGIFRMSKYMPTLCQLRRRRPSLQCRQARDLGLEGPQRTSLRPAFSDQVDFLEPTRRKGFPAAHIDLQLAAFT